MKLALNATVRIHFRGTLMGKTNGGQVKNSFKKFDEYVDYAINNTDHASKIIARSFYKILRKNGFNDSQIINIANHLLDCLIKSLDEYKEKVNGSPDAETHEKDLFSG